nr:hypothetical protein [Chthoniobacter flavus]
MIDHQVDDHRHAQLVGPVHELDKVAARAVPWIDGVIVGDVVAVIPVGRLLKRRQPEGADPEGVQVIQPPHQSLKIADAIAVLVHEGIDIQGIDDGVFVPEILDHMAGSVCSRASQFG